MKREIKVYKAFDKVDGDESVFIIPMGDDKPIKMIVSIWDEKMKEKHVILKFAAIASMLQLTVPVDESRMINKELVMIIGEADL